MNASYIAYQTLNAIIFFFFTTTTTQDRISVNRTLGSIGTQRYRPSIQFNRGLIIRESKFNVLFNHNEIKKVRLFFFYYVILNFCFLNVSF